MELDTMKAARLCGPSLADLPGVNGEIHPLQLTCITHRTHQNERKI
jgi:hypothetical protein